MRRCRSELGGACACCWCVERVLDFGALNTLGVCGLKLGVTFAFWSREPRLYIALSFVMIKL